MMSSFMRLIAFFALAVQFFTTTTAFTSVSNTAYRSYLSTTPIMKNNNIIISTTTSNSQLYMATATPTVPAPVKKREKKVSYDNVTDDEKAKDRGWLVRLYNDVSYLYLYVLIKVWRIVLIYIANSIRPLTPFIDLPITTHIMCT